MAHYSKVELELYRHGKMSLPARLACSLHLKFCEDCQQRLKELREEDALLEELRDSLQAFGVDETEKADMPGGKKPGPAATGTSLAAVDGQAQGA